MATASVSIAGAGSIGCFVGGMLANAGVRVSMLARPRIITEIAAAGGLRVTSYEGFERRVAPDQLTMSENPELLGDAGIVLVAVKSNDTAEVAGLIAHHAQPNAVVVSLQNGVGNAAVLRAALPGRRVLAGMVPFNVIALGDGRFHRATSGDIVIESDAGNIAAQLSVAGLQMRASANIAGVQWGKLLVNLNNALNALSGLPLRDQLAQRPWRMLLADQMAEALVAMAAEGVRPVAMTPLPPWMTPYVLRLPDFLFQLVAGQMLKIDPQARSSMWEDLQRGGRTEIDFLQGLIVEIAARHALAAPLSRRIVTLIRQAEQRGAGSPGLTPETIRPL